MSDTTITVANCNQGDYCGIRKGQYFCAPYKVLAVSEDGSRYKVQGCFIFSIGTQSFWVDSSNCALLDTIPKNMLKYYA